MKRSLITILVSLVMLTLGTGVMPSPNLPGVAHASGNCTLKGCTGKDPISQGCSQDSYAVYTAQATDQAGINIGQVQLKYSPSCMAYWSKVTVNITNFGGSFSATVEGTLSYYNSGTQYASNTSSAYTDMIGGEQVDACGNFNDGSQGYTYCTPRS